MENFELNLSHEELVKRTDKDHLIPKKMLDVGAKEYENLAPGDKEALKHLTKAAFAVDDVFMQQDNHKNLAFKQWLEAEIANGNEDARLTKILFDAQIGMNAVDSEANKIFLAKDEKSLPGKGFYPADLSIEEFHNILIKMLKNGQKEDVKAILNQRSMVLRDGDGLRAVDYTEFFAKEFGFNPETFRDYLHKHEPDLAGQQGMSRTEEGKRLSRRSEEKYAEAIHLYETTTEDLKSIAKRLGLTYNSLGGYIRRNHPEAIERHKHIPK